MKSSKTIFAEKGDDQAKISDFNILSVLGAGTFGKVYLVQKKDNEKVYAMKTLRKYDIIKNR